MGEKSRSLDDAQGGIGGGVSGGECAEHACVVGREVVTGRGMQGHGKEESERTFMGGRRKQGRERENQAWCDSGKGGGTVGGGLHEGIRRMSRNRGELMMEVVMVMFTGREVWRWRYREWGSRGRRKIGRGGTGEFAGESGGGTMGRGVETEEVLEMGWRRSSPERKTVEVGVGVGRMSSGRRSWRRRRRRLGDGGVDGDNSEVLVAGARSGGGRRGDGGGWTPSSAILE